MLKLSKMSKIFLTLGLILTFATSTVYAADISCSKARKQLEEAKEAYNSKKQQIETIYQKALKDAKDKVSTAQKSCVTDLTYCSAYQTALAEQERTSAIAKTDYESSLEQLSDSDIQAKQEIVETACSNKIAKDGVGEAEENTGASKKDKKSQQAATTAQSTAAQKKATQGADDEKKKNAQAAYSKAQNDYNKAEQKVKDQKRIMETLCEDGVDSVECQEAMNNYNNAITGLEGASTTLSTKKNEADSAAIAASRSAAAAKKAQEEADKAAKKDQARAQAKVDDAQEDVDKYCDKTSKKYNPKKCNSAQQDLADAKSDKTYKQMEADKKTAEATAASEREAAATSAAKAKKEAYASDPSQAASAYSQASDAAVKSAEAQKEAAEKKRNDAQSELEAASADVDAACVKKNSKACKAAKEKYAAAESAYNSAEQSYNQAKSNHENLESQNKMAKEALQECTGVSCDTAKASMDKENASATALQAQKDAAEASRAKAKADQEYNNALNRMALACKNPDTPECSEAKAKLQEAKTAQETADAEYETAQNDLFTAKTTLENANGKLNDAKVAEADGIVADKQAKVTEACKEGNENTPECTAAKQELEAAQIEQRKVKLDQECAKDPESEACKSATKSVEKDQKNAAIEAAEAKMAEARNKANKICEQYGASSTQCADAMRDYQKTVKAVEEETCGSDKACLDGLRYGEGVVKASGRLKTIAASYNSGSGERGIANIETNQRKIEVIKGSGSADSLSGYRSGLFDYKSSIATKKGSELGGEDVLDVVTRRAALAIVSLKPIVYIFAGFGLIAFAWMAIFNKLSWKWFANIAMGLFLVANMGRFIEYFVAGDGDNHYYIGVWDNNVGTTSQNNQLANAFKDVYYVYGDVNYNTKGLIDFSEEIAREEQKLKERYYSGGEVVTEAAKPENKFCGKDTGATGWANFTSCLKDIVSTAKKAANTVKTVKATAEDIVDRVEAVKDTAKNIQQAVKAMDGASLSEIVANAGTILNNVNAAVSTTTGAVGSLTSAASTISNNVQDMGKSVEMQQWLTDKRNSGEATNAVDAFISGQEWDKDSKSVKKEEVQRTEKDNAGNEIKLVDAYGKPITTQQVATSNNWLSQTANMASNINQKSNELNNITQDGLAQVGAVTNVIENTAPKDVLGFGSDKSWNEKRQEKKEQKHQQAVAENFVGTQAANQAYRQQVQEQNNIKQAEKQLEAEQRKQEDLAKNENYYTNQEYTKAVDEANDLYDKMNAQAAEAERLEKEAKEKSQKAANACASNPNSAVCTTAQQAADAAKDAAANKKQQAENTKQQYSEAKQKVETSYGNALDSNKNKAQQDYDNAKSQASDAKQQMEQTSEKLSTASADAAKAKEDYDSAVSAASDAKQAYDAAVKSGGDAAEIAKLKAEYEAKLAAMSNANAAYKKQQSEYNALQQQYNDAQTAYNKAYGDANAASERLASYTNEDVNNTGESRKKTNEDKDNQALVNQYKSETSPTAVAQASKNNYIQSKNSTDVAQYTLNEKRALAEQAKKDYEAAAQKAKETGSEEDQRTAERLKKNYNLALNEAAAAEADYKKQSSELSGYTADYVAKAIDAEEYKQSVYTKQMKEASASINQYEAAVTKQLKVVDNAATAYMSAKNNVKEGDDASLQKAANLYNEYKKAKTLYDEYQNNLSVARNNYTTAKSSYDTSVAEVARLKELLEDN